MLRDLFFFFQRVGLCVLLAPTSALAESEAHIELRGTVPIELKLEIEALSSARNLNLIKGENNTPIAKVWEFANSADGYTIHISSINDGALIHTEFSSSQVPYLLSYDQSPFQRPKKDAEIFKFSGPLDRPVRSPSLLKIQIQPSPDIMAGSYEDLLLIEMRAP